MSFKFFVLKFKRNGTQTQEKDMWVYNPSNIKSRAAWTLPPVAVRAWILSASSVIPISLSCCNCDWKYSKNGYHLSLSTDRLISSSHMCEIVSVTLIKIMI